MGLWYICGENDDLMVFQIQCNGRITRVGEEEEEEEERGSLSQGEWIYRERQRRRESGGRKEFRGAAAIWLLSGRKQESGAREERKRVSVEVYERTNGKGKGRDGG